MRRIVVVLALGALLAMPTLASAASPTMAQFNALKNKVNRLQNRVLAIEACSELVVPVSRFGNFTNEGYLYGTLSGTTFTGGVVPALDIVDDLTGLVPGDDFDWYQIVDPACVEATTGRIASMAPRAGREIPSAFSFRIAARAS